MISVILCTHNPRREYLDAVITALRRQSAPLVDWELLLLDNASDTRVSTMVDLAWHPQGRHIREDRLGLTPARLRGIQESEGDLLVFVDDDNLLSEDYLAVASRISRDMPGIGAWSGCITPRFEVPPEAWTQSYWNLLAIRPVTADCISSKPWDEAAMPCGAGMCVRRAVASAYHHKVEADPARGDLDRKGATLSSAGDSDLAGCSWDVGLGTACLADLRLTHLIPQCRLTERYLLALVEGINYSHGILAALRAGQVIKPRHSLTSRLKHIKHVWSLDPRGRRFFFAATRGQKRAEAEAYRFIKKG